MEKEQQWEYGPGGLIDLCNGCRFEKPECPVSQGEIDFLPAGSEDPGSTIKINGNYYELIAGSGIPLINPFVCVTFERRGISAEASLSNSSSQ